MTRGPPPTFRFVLKYFHNIGDLCVWTVFFSEVTCGPPPTVAHAKAETTGSRYLDRATYTCESGYYSDGPQNHLVCGKRTKWEGDEIVCRGNPVCVLICVRVVIVVHNFTDLIVHKYVYQGLFCLELVGWAERKNYKNTNQRRFAQIR